MRRGCRRHHRQRPITAGHSQRIRAVQHGCLGESCQALSWSQDANFDPPFTRPLCNLRMRSRAAT